MTERAWIEQWVRPAIVSAMIGAVALSWVGLFSLMLPGWNRQYLAVFCFLAALEGFIAHRLLRTRLHRLDSRWRYRLGELFVIYFLLQIAANLVEGELNPLANLPRFDTGTLLSFGFVAACWVAATWTAQDLEALSGPPESYRGYIPPADLLRKRFYAGGVVLMLGAGLSRVEVARLTDLERPGVPGIVLNVLVYFALGVVMLGQMQYTTLTRRWTAQGASVGAGMGRRWVRYSVVFLALTALLAFLLPTGYTVGLLDVGLYVLTFLIALVQFLVALILAPFLWLLSLFGIGGGGSGVPPPPARLPSPPPTTGGAEFNLLDLLRNILFWALALGILVYVARLALRNRSGLRAALGRLGPMRFLANVWTAALRRLRGYAGAVAARLPTRARLPTAPDGAPRRPGLFRRVGSLPPREQIRYYYLDTVRRAAREGHPRRMSQSPREYEQELGPRLEESRPELGGLTSAFEEARYSPHPVESSQAERARTRWQRLGDALKALSKEPDTTDGRPAPPRGE